MTGVFTQPSRVRNSIREDTALAPLRFAPGSLPVRPQPINVIVNATEATNHAAVRKIAAEEFKRRLSAKTLSRHIDVDEVDHRDNVVSPHLRRGRVCFSIICTLAVFAVLAAGVAAYDESVIALILRQIYWGY